MWRSWSASRSRTAALTEEVPTSIPKKTGMAMYPERIKTPEDGNGGNPDLSSGDCVSSPTWGANSWAARSLNFKLSIGRLEANLVQVHRGLQPQLHFYQDLCGQGSDLLGQLRTV
ncbi:hypothetical protein SBA4_2790011 [Candidatus Sulfopaludibacter sp. SbA4]|nr:hypothetical protein SBA4_2790011 [Candidatus Sulfopaludibacter sp. SbA4]